MYKASPGETREVFKLFDLLNLPNPHSNLNAPLKGPIHPFSFIWDEKEDVLNGRPFSYYKYMGSNTQPPCAENVLWLIADHPMGLSTTVIAMFRDALIDPNDKFVPEW